VIFILLPGNIHTFVTVLFHIDILLQC
jgi:hypothetical protein